VAASLVTFTAKPPDLRSVETAMGAAKPAKALATTTASRKLTPQDSAALMALPQISGDRASLVKRVTSAVRRATPLTKETASRPR